MAFCKHGNTCVLNSKQWNSPTLVNAKFIIMFPEQYFTEIVTNRFDRNVDIGQL